MAFAPILEARVKLNGVPIDRVSDTRTWPPTTVIGTWVNHEVKIPDGTTYRTGIEHTNPWWQITQGRWFVEGKKECVVGSAFARKHGVRNRPLAPGFHLTAYTPDGHPGPVLEIVGVADTGGPEDEAVIVPLVLAQQLDGKPGMYRRLYVSALTKPEDAFARKDPKTMTPAEFDTWYCTPYISSIALQISEELKGTDVRVIRRVAEGEGHVLSRVRTLLWLVTFAALLSSALAVGASAAASVIERRSEIGLMKALGANSGLVGVLLAAEQLLLALVGGGIGYAVGILLARALGQRIFGFTPEPKLFVLLVILVLAAVITLIGSAYPLRRAARYDPAPILRGE
jgi:putative ABC transport system permease protein